MVLVTWECKHAQQQVSRGTIWNETYGESGVNDPTGADKTVSRGTASVLLADCLDCSQNKKGLRDDEANVQEAKKEDLRKLPFQGAQQSR